MDFTTIMIVLALSIGIAITVLIVLLWIASNETKIVLPTPILALDEGVFTSSARTIIHASADQVFKAVSNFEDYSWSSELKFAWGSKADKRIPIVGSTGTMTVTIPDFATTTVRFQITHLDHKTRTIVGCSTEYPRCLLETRRVQEVSPVEDHKGLCEYKSWMTSSGIASFFLMLTVKDELADMQKQFAEDLKSFIEGRKH